MHVYIGGRPLHPGRMKSAEEGGRRENGRRLSVRGVRPLDSQNILVAVPVVVAPRIWHTHLGGRMKVRGRGGMRVGNEWDRQDERLKMRNQTYRYMETGGDVILTV